MIIGYLSIRTRGVYFIFSRLSLPNLAIKLSSTEVRSPADRTACRACRRRRCKYSVYCDIWIGTILLQPTIWPSSAFVVAYIFARWIVGSPFGSTLAAVRDNDDRATYLGYNVAAIKRRAFRFQACLLDFQGRSGRITSLTSHLSCSTGLCRASF